MSEQKKGDGKFQPPSSEDVIPVIHVSGVYFPTQRLRVKLSDNMAKMANLNERNFGLICKTAENENVTYKVGVIVKVIEQETFFTSMFSKSTVEILVEGVQRFKLEKVYSNVPPMSTCKVQIYDDEKASHELLATEEGRNLTEKLRQVSIKFCDIPRNSMSANLNSQKKAAEIKYIQSAAQLCFMACSLINSPQRNVRQGLLDINDLKERIEKVVNLLQAQIEDFSKNGGASEVEGRANSSPSDNLRKFYQGISSGMGGGSNPQGQGQGQEDDLSILEDKLRKLQLTEEAKEIAEREIKKLRKMGQQSQEYHVGLNYLQTISELPWGISDKESLDPKKAREILDRDHFGLEDIKKRIVQFLAVRKLKANNQGSILCFNGPPGVGKTSLGKSIAEALGRKFYRVSLGGVRDETEIRGHRRTYVGAMPGVIIQSLRKVKTSNPVFLLDEIDKMTRDARGDPGSAMLEVLDPAQNNAFSDHFLATPFDLSKVLFVATSNDINRIHPALMDRLEIIELSGYSLQEKTQIGKKYLIPRCIKDNGITPEVIQIPDPMLVKVIEEYTMESGVRNLERQLGTLCRTVAYQYAIAEDVKGFKQIRVDKQVVEDALGNPKFDVLMSERITRPGVAIGLAYTTFGGRALLIETIRYPGNGHLVLTGKLGEVMRESVNTCLSWIKANAHKLGIISVPQSQTVSVQSEDQEPRALAENYFRKFDIHVHFPAAAVPKDGPSAGITIATALTSLMTNRRVRSNVAMTGEISLQGLVLPIGGVKDKCIAAHRNGMKLVILPEQNRKDANEIPKDVLKTLEVKFVKSIEQVMELALEKKVDLDFVARQNKPLFRTKL